MEKILITDKVPGHLLDSLRDKYQIIEPQGQYFSRQEIIDRIDQVLGVISIVRTMDEKTLSQGKNLAFLATSSVGFDHIDMDYCNRMKIAVLNTPETVRDPVAELTLGLILNLVRGIGHHERELRESLLVKNNFITNDHISLRGKKLGIIGLGNIGRRLAEIARPLGLEILYTGRSRKEEAEKELDASFLDFDQLVEESDIISLHLPYSQETHHIINKEVLDRMKKTAYLINVSRGKLIDERALIQALKEGKIRGAGLDVFENEPHVDPVMKEMDNIVITPHMGTLTKEDRENMILEAVQASLDFLEGKKPRQLVNKEIFE